MLARKCSATWKGWDRTVARKSSIGGICDCAGGLYVRAGGAWSFVWGDKPLRGDGTGLRNFHVDYSNMNFWVRISKREKIFHTPEDCHGKTAAFLYITFCATNCGLYRVRAISYSNAARCTLPLWNRDMRLPQGGSRNDTKKAGRKVLFANAERNDKCFVAIGVV